MPTNIARAGNSKKSSQGTTAASPKALTATTRIGVTQQIAATAPPMMPVLSMVLSFTVGLSPLLRRSAQDSTKEAARRIKFG